MIWQILTLLLIAKIIFAAIALFYSLKFLRPRTPAETRLFPQPNVASRTAIHIVIPLLREQAILPSLLVRFDNLLRTTENVGLILVTTEREITENGSKVEGTTVEQIRNYIVEQPRSISWLTHLHYPNFNSVVSPQLNFAVNHVNSISSADEVVRYIAVYNADSIVDGKSISFLQKFAESNSPVCQQSSLFLWNTPELLERNRYLLACFGLYQSGWTLQHELTRLLFNKTRQPWMPDFLTRNSLVHCVSNGLMIRADVLAEVGGFPTTKWGGEDLALGFILKVHGYHPDAVPTLENAETPSTHSILFIQLAGWFLGTLGYLLFWRLVPESRRIQQNTVLLTLTGILDSLKWLVKGTLILSYLILSHHEGRFAFGIMLYLVYLYLPVSAVLWLWTKLPRSLFPRPNHWRLLIALQVYWTVPILRSLPAFTGLVWGIRILLGYRFVKPKTERF